MSTILAMFVGASILYSVISASDQTRYALQEKYLIDVQSFVTQASLAMSQSNICESVLGGSFMTAANDLEVDPNEVDPAYKVLFAPVGELNKIRIKRVSVTSRPTPIIPDGRAYLGNLNFEFDTPQGLIPIRNTSVPIYMIRNNVGTILDCRATTFAVDGVTIQDRICAMRAESNLIYDPETDSCREPLTPSIASGQIGKSSLDN